MSASAEFQKLLIDTLTADVGVSALVGDRIYDASPAGADFPYIDVGPSDFLPEDAECITARIETVQLDIWHRDQGRKNPCKRTVDAVYAALHEAALALPDPYALVTLRVVLTRVLDDPDGITLHGVVQVQGEIETS